MKKFFLFAAALVALTACGGSTESAPKTTVSSAPKDGDLTHELVSKALFEKSAVKSNFKVMEYGQLDSCFTEILDYHLPYNQKADYYMECYEKNLKTNKAQAKADLDSAKCYQKKDSVERANFKPELFGWKMKVQYMSDNVYEAEVYLNLDKTYATLNRYELLKVEGITKE